MRKIMRSTFSLFLIPSIFCGCSTPVVKEHRDVAVNPSRVYQECVEMSPGDVLIYEFDCAGWSVNFDIRYQEESRVLYRFTKNNTTIHRGKFYPDRKGRYCLAWTNTHSSPTRLSYSLHVTRE